MRAPKIRQEQVKSRSGIQRRKNTINDASNGQNSTTGTFIFQDNRPQTAPQRVLYAIANNNPHAKQVAQRKPTDVQITGITHLVVPKGESIFEGKEGKQLDNRDRVTIEPDQSLWSRRGPNQEGFVNRELIDKRGLHMYEWFRVLNVKGRRFDNNSFLRDETFVTAKPIRDKSVDQDLSREVSKQGMTNVFKKAHGEGSVEDITEGQKSYQEWLQSTMSMGQIMDRHRSVGFEYEFATYCNKKGKSPKVAAHQEIGKSAALSPLFKLPFILETDSNDEIEAVMPPFLIADTGVEINKGAADTIYKAYRSSLIGLRDTNKPKGKEKPKLLSSLKSKLTTSGLGKGWSFSGLGSQLYLSGTRKKHASSPDYIYSQMNISLTPEEIADMTDTAPGADKAASTTHADVVLANAAVKDALHVALGGIFGHFVKLMGIRKSEEWIVRQNVLTAITNISKGLAGLVAIPSILADNARKKQDVPISSSVKEFGGIWLKDSIPNIVDSSLPDVPSRSMMLEVLVEAENAMKKGMDSTVEQQLKAMRPAMEKSFTFGKKGKADILLDGFLEQYRQEYKATIQQVIVRLKKKAPKMQKVKGGSEFENEEFGGTGLGVRKDTFVNIKSGDARRMHLAEMRNDDAIRMLLNERRKRKSKN